MIVSSGQAIFKVFFHTGAHLIMQLQTSRRTRAREAQMAGAYPTFCSMKQLRVFLLPRDGILVHHRVTPSSISPVPIYTPGWRETMWGKVS